MLAQGPPECWAAGGSSSPHFPGIELEPSLPLARRPVAQVLFLGGLRGGMAGPGCGYCTRVAVFRLLET